MPVLEQHAHGGAQCSRGLAVLNQGRAHVVPLRLIAAVRQRIGQTARAQVSFGGSAKKRFRMRAVKVVRR